MVVKKLEEITGKLCDKYCIYARIYSSEEEQEKLDDICKTCPMNEFFELLDILPKYEMGDFVYAYSEKLSKVLEYEIVAIHLSGKDYEYMLEAVAKENDEPIDAIYFESENINKTVFNTKEGAEQALVKRSENNG